MSQQERVAIVRIRLSSRGVPVGPTLRDHTQRRVHFVMSRFEGQIRQVDVQLSAQLGTESASRAERCCRISVSVSRLPKAVVEEDTQADVYLAIDRAVDRAARTVARRLERDRDMASLGPPRNARGGRS